MCFYAKILDSRSPIVVGDKFRGNDRFLFVQQELVKEFYQCSVLE